MRDYDDKNVESFKRMRSIKETKTGRARAMEPHAPLLSSSFVAESLLHGLSSERKCLFSSAYLPFLASPSERPDNGPFPRSCTKYKHSFLRRLYRRPMCSLDCIKPSDWKPQFRKHHEWYPASVLCNRCQFVYVVKLESGRIDTSNILVHPRNLLPSPWSLGSSSVQFTASDRQIG